MSAKKQFRWDYLAFATTAISAFILFALAVHSNASLTIGGATGILGVCFVGAYYGPRGANNNTINHVLVSYVFFTHYCAWLATSVSAGLTHVLAFVNVFFVIYLYYSGLAAVLADLVESVQARLSMSKNAKDGGMLEGIDVEKECAAMQAEMQYEREKRIIARMEELPTPAASEKSSTDPSKPSAS